MGLGHFIFEVSISHKNRHIHSSEILISSLQKPLSTQQTNTRHEIHGLSGIQTRGYSNRVVADLSLRPHGQHYGHLFVLFCKFPF